MMSDASMIAAKIELSDPQIVLRLMREEDAEEICQAVRESHQALGEWLSWAHADYGISDAIEFAAAQHKARLGSGDHSFVIRERESGRLLGGVGINQVEQVALRANLGYWLRTSATRKGYATAAVRLLARWVLEQLALERIEIVAAVGNLRSQRVAERAGAQREGLARRRLRVRGVQHDAVVYSLVKSDLAGSD